LTFGRGSKFFASLTLIARFCFITLGSGARATTLGPGVRYHNASSSRQSEAHPFSRKGSSNGFSISSTILSVSQSSMGVSHFSFLLNAFGHPKMLTSVKATAVMAA
jgi:hypothetical protein